MSKSSKAIVVVFLIVAILTLVVVGLGSALMPLIVSFGLAYLLFPLVRRMEARGIKRGFAVSSVFVLVVLLLVAAALAVLPGLVTDAREFLAQLPENSHKAIDKAEQVAAKLGVKLDIREQGLKELARTHASALSADVVAKATKALGGAFSNLFRWFLSILNLFLIPLFFFYVINDYEKITGEIESFVPRKLKPKLKRYAKMGNTVLSGYIRGQILVAVILGLLYGTGLALVGLRFGFLIGFVAGLLSIIPYVGFTLGLVTALMIGLANYTGMGTVIGIAVVFTLVQLLEGLLITPKLVGNKVGLSAFVTLLALIIGGNLLGLAGMLIAIPSAAIIKVILADLKKEYRKSPVYRK